MLLWPVWAAGSLARVLYEPQSASKLFLYRSQLQYEAKTKVFAQVIADRNRDVKGSDVDDEIHDEESSARRADGGIVCGTRVHVGWLRWRRK